MNVTEVFEKLQASDVTDVLKTAQKRLEAFAADITTKMQLSKVAQVRHGQREKGWTTAHDNEEGLQHLAELIEGYVEQLLPTHGPPNLDKKDLTFAEEKFLTVAALSVAALEVIEVRRGEHGKKPDGTGD